MKVGPYEVRTASGRYLNFANPHVDQICITDIAIGLFRHYRWLGQHGDISVGLHSIYCQTLAKAKGYSPELQLACLLHDAEEAYTGDIPKPLKRLLDEKHFVMLRQVIFLKYGCTWDDRIKEIDLAVTAWERYMFVEEIDDDWYDVPRTPDSETTKTLNGLHRITTETFLSTFCELYGC